MPLSKITLKPGINKQLTATLNEGGYTDGNCVRFRDGLPQPIGGWAKTSGNSFAGMCRGMHSWTTLAGTPTIGVGTNLKLYIYEGGTFYDVTPVQNTVSTTNGFSTTNASTSVLIAATAHGASVGDYVEIPSVTVGGLTISGEYTVTTVPTANSITITAATAATSTATSTGSVTLTFLLSVGLQNSLIANGWGVGTWGSGTWGTARTSGTGTLTARVWSIDNWGEEFVGVARGSALYNWKPSGGTSTRAAAISGSPLYNNAILTGLPERHLISLGAETGGALDPMLVRWSDVENYSTWNATANNSAGSQRLAGGNQIMRGVPANGQILVWTDSVLYAMRFQGLPYVYGFYQLGTNCGLVAPNAVTVLGGIAYWMGSDRFLYYDGNVETLHCDVWDAVFRNNNPGQIWKTFAGVNSSFTEIAFFYCSAGSIEIDSVAVFDREGGVWWIGQNGLLAATAWEDLGSFPNPIAAHTNGYLYNHEFGTDADGVAMGSYATTGYFDIADGESYAVLDQIIPDFGDQSGAVEITLFSQQFPNGPVTTKGPYAITQSTRYISPRLRGRQLAMKFQSSGVGAFWKLGGIRGRISPDGRNG